MRSKFYKWFLNWLKINDLLDRLNVFISYPNELTPEIKDNQGVIIDIFEPITDNINHKAYFDEIIFASDMYETSTYLKLNDRLSITKEEIEKYGFVLEDNGYYKRQNHNKLI